MSEPHAVTVGLPDWLHEEISDLAAIHTGGDIGAMIVRLLARMISPEKAYSMEQPEEDHT